MENAELRAQNERLRVKIARTKELFELREAATAHVRVGTSKWTRTAALATFFFFVTGFQWEPTQFTRDASALVRTGVHSLFASIE